MPQPVALDRVAAAFGIEQWPVTAVKAFVGHSLATASGDQVIGALGAFKYGIVPGIKTIDAVACDVHQDHLSLSTEDRKVGDQALDVAFINSKGFGGNNASALVLAPHVTERMLRKRHGQAAFDAYLARREGTRAAAAAYDQQALQGKHLRIRVADARVGFDFTWDNGRFRACHRGSEPDLTISASAHDFLLLARREEDPDTLFFSRRLSMEGDTELGLLVKNTLDAIELPTFELLRRLPARL